MNMKTMTMKVVLLGLISKPNVIISVYMPSGSSGDSRQAFKMTFLEDFYQYISELIRQVPNLIIAGDYNICHKSIDIHNPQRNQKISSLPEKEWKDLLLLI